MGHLIPRTAAVILALIAVAPGAQVSSGYVPRTGFVTLQFDDSHELDYTMIFPKLQQYGFKGSFGYVVESSDMGIEHEPAMIKEIYKAGHEIQDHTTRHDWMWATHVDTLDDGVTEWIPTLLATPAQWDSLCQRSRYVLDSLGIAVVGWNQPGGGCDFGQIPGYPGWASKNDTSYCMYSVAASYYSYAIGCGVFSNTAHLNLRGHNCPDRFPLFNVPHETIDGRGLSGIKRDIADAVASGLWYLAVSHSWCMENVRRSRLLIDWLAGTDIEVVTCREGVERIRWGVADPAANQIPQAAMLHDRDRNGKPDGFTGDCSWDTLTAPPVEGVRCLRVSGAVEFFAHGPQAGKSAFSVWVKSETGSPCNAAVARSDFDFDWEWLGETWAAVSCAAEWTRADTLAYPQFRADLGGEVDRVRYTVIAQGTPVLLAYPELVYLPPPCAGVHASPATHQGSPRLLVCPNPARAGDPLRVKRFSAASTILVHDILGRRLLAAEFKPGQEEATIETRDFAPGVLFVTDTPSPGRSTKVVVYR